MMGFGTPRRARTWSLAVVAAVAMLAAACGGSSGGSAAGDASEDAGSGEGDSGGGDQPTLTIGGIPDQDRSRLEERFGGMADYLEQEVGIPVEYQPSTSYSALVTAFGNGDIKLGWFGGLTGVQARNAVPEGEAIIQRPQDKNFRSVFIANSSVDGDSLDALKGASFTFGSQSSASGHLMPRFFLRQANIDPTQAFSGKPSFSGSHDKTWKLVESGSFDAGALNATVWDGAVEEEEVDTSKVRVIKRTDPYFDYHWVANTEINETYGEGTVAEIAEAMKAMESGSGTGGEVLKLFDAEGFTETKNSNYERIETVARDLGLIQQ
jgi:phosphonate transport system substrate-binding protein